MFYSTKVLLISLLLMNFAHADYFVENINWSENFDNFSMKKKFKNAEITPIIRNNEIVAHFFIVKNISYDVYKHSTMVVHFYKTNNFDRVQINTYKKPYKSESKDIYFEFHEANIVYTDIFNKLTNQYGRNKYISMEIAKEGSPIWEINPNLLISTGLVCAIGINECSVWIEYIKNEVSIQNKYKVNNLKEKLEINL